MGFHAKRQESSAAFYKSVINDAQSHTSQRHHVRKEQSHHFDLPRTVEHLEKTMNKIVGSLQKLECGLECAASCEADRYSHDKRFLRDDAKRNPEHSAPHTGTFSHGRQNDLHSAPRDLRDESRSTFQSGERYYNDRPSHD